MKILRQVLYSLYASHKSKLVCPTGNPRQQTHKQVKVWLLPAVCVFLENFADKTILCGLKFMYQPSSEIIVIIIEPKEDKDLRRRPNPISAGRSIIFGVLFRKFTYTHGRFYLIIIINSLSMHESDRH